MEKEEYEKFFNPAYIHCTPKQQKINKLKHIYDEKELKKLKSKQLGKILYEKNKGIFR
jgi:hypothetical protein